MNFKSSLRLIKTINFKNRISCFSVLSKDGSIMKDEKSLIFNALRRTNSQNATSFDVNNISNEQDINIDLDLRENPKDSFDTYTLENKSDISFRYNEMLICQVFEEGKNTYSNRMITLAKNGIFVYKNFNLFHEHIIYRSHNKQSRDSQVTFNFLSKRFEFKRPSLYEYVYIKCRKAVPSHYSIFTLAPILLELGKNTKVLECGTGSGTMTLFLSQNLGHTGKLHTFDQDKEKSIKAKELFWVWKNSFDSSSTHSSDKWPCNVKFGVVDFCNHVFNHSFENYYDSIYLDMGELQKGVLNAFKLVKTKGVIVANAMHLTQILNMLNELDKNKLAYNIELVIEPSNRLWELRKFSHTKKHDEQKEKLADETFNWSCRLEDRSFEKIKRDGLFYNYWSGFLIKIRKI